MRNLSLVSAVALAVSGISSAAAIAQASPQAAAPGVKTPDPNEIVCEKQEEIGSRLASHRVCKTRAEWAEERRLNRMDIDKIQTQRDLSH